MSRKKIGRLRERVLNLTITEFFSEEFLLGVLNTDNPHGKNYAKYVKQLRKRMQPQLSGAPNKKLKDFFEFMNTERYDYRSQWIGNEGTATLNIFLRVLDLLDLRSLWEEVPAPPDTETEAILKEFKKLRGK